MARHSVKSGRLRHLVTLQTMGTTLGTRGQATDQWSDAVIDIPASIEPMSGRELEGARQLDATASHKITMRYLTQLAPMQRPVQKRLIFNASDNTRRIFNIGWVDDSQERGHKVTIIATEEVEIIAVSDVLHAMTATVAAAASVSAHLIQTLLYTATVNGLSNVSGNVSLTRGLTATINALSSVTADMIAIRGFAATVAGVSNVSADLMAIRGFTATVNAISSVSADLAVSHTLEATVNGLSSVTGDLTGTFALAATVNGVSSVTADLVVAHTLVATVNGVSSVTADLRKIIPITATVNGVSSVTAGLDVLMGMTATVNGVSSVTADLAVTHTLVATVNGVSSVTADLVVTHTLVATVAGVSSVTADLTKIIPITATVNGISSVTADLTPTFSLTGTVNGVSSVTADLTATFALTGTVNGVSSVTALITDYRATVNGVSSVTAALTVIVPAGILDPSTIDSANFTGGWSNYWAGSFFQEPAKTSTSGDGDVVGAWLNNTSTFGIMQQSNAALKPLLRTGDLNGHSVVDFVSNDVLKTLSGTFMSNFFAAGGFTYITLVNVKQVSSTDGTANKNEAIFMNGSNNIGLYMNKTGTKFQSAHNNGGLVETNTYSTGVWQVVVCRYDGTTLSQKVGTSADATDTAGNPTLTGLVRFGENVAHSENFLGKMATMLMWKNDLTDAQVNEVVNDHLQEYWGSTTFAWSDIST